MTRIRTALTATILALCAALPAAAADGDIGIELNKLEPAGEACRVYMLMENKAPLAFESLRIDLIFFGTDGVIARRIGPELGPLAKERSVVKLFDITGQPCDSIGRILVNDVVACKADGADQTGCIDRLRLSSRTAVPFGK